MSVLSPNAYTVATPDLSPATFIAVCAGSRFGTLPEQQDVELRAWKDYRIERRLAIGLPADLRRFATSPPVCNPDGVQANERKDLKHNILLVEVGHWIAHGTVRR
jgi:hypothetical protein